MGVVGNGAQLDVQCKIRDNLHGSVTISPLEHAVIAHPAIQRLRRIRQTSFLYLAFPGASHSRFEHSLGVLHLATLTWQKLYDNQMKLAQNFASISDYQQLEHNRRWQLLRPLEVLDAIFHSSYISQALRLAALMHDVGHPPFSHSGELLLPELTTVFSQNDELPPYLRDFLRKRIHRQQRVDHEVFTVLLIDKVLREVEEQPTIDPQDVISIVCSDIEPVADSEIARYGINSLGHELLSSDLDIDRMDYLLRDSKECGVTYGVFDFSRILDSLVLYWSRDDDRIHVGLKFSGLAAYEDYLQARLLMYTQIYFHKTPVAAEVMFHNLARKISYTIPSNLDQFIRLDEYNILSDLGRACNDESLLDDLFYRRNLWKRVFEVTEKDNNRQQLIAEAKHNLEQSNEEFVFVSYCRGLIAQADGQHSSLKIIKKNHQQIPQIEAIEDYSRFYRERPTIELHRCYTKNSGVLPPS